MFMEHQRQRDTERILLESFRQDGLGMRKTSGGVLDGFGGGVGAWSAAEGHGVDAGRTS